MATAQSILIDAVRRIVGIDAESLALLKEIQRRGGIDGIKTQLGGDGGLGEDQRTAEGEDCCTDPGDPPRPWSPPWGDDPATDCATGQPLQFTPGGFPQPETCKGDCEKPDPAWQAGYVWHFAGSSECSNYGHTPQESSDRGFAGFPVRPYAYADDGSVLTWESYNPDTGGWVRRITRQPCTDSRPIDCGYGCINEAPIISDCQDWEPDGTTNYTLANGCITASSCDTDASQQAKQCNDCIIVCAGDKEVRICGTIDGGYSVTDMDTGETTRYSASGVPQ